MWCHVLLFFHQKCQCHCQVQYLGVWWSFISHVRRRLLRVKNFWIIYSLCASLHGHIAWGSPPQLIEIPNSIILCPQRMCWHLGIEDCNYGSCLDRLQHDTLPNSICSLRVPSLFCGTPQYSRNHIKFPASLSRNSTGHLETSKVSGWILVQHRFWTGKVLTKTQPLLPKEYKMLASYGRSQRRIRIELAKDRWLDTRQPEKRDVMLPMASYPAQTSQR